MIAAIYYFFRAGVGRTGVFVAIDTIVDKLERGIINSIDVFGQVCAMRERRMNMVQTLVGTRLDPPLLFLLSARNLFKTPQECLYACINK